MTAMKQTMPWLTVVVPTHNRAHLLGECLEALSRQDIPAGEMEVIVVANGCTDDTEQVVRQWQGTMPWLRLIQEQQPGLNRARNLGWQAAAAPYVAYLDDDARPEPGWARAIVKAFGFIQPRPAALGGPVLPCYLEPLPSWYPTELDRHTWGEASCFLSGPRARSGFFGMNMAFRRDLLAQCGGFREDLGMVAGALAMGGEQELFFRLYERCPYFWYDTGMAVQHVIRAPKRKPAYRLYRSYLGGVAGAIFSARPIDGHYLWQAIDGVALLVLAVPRALLDRQSFRRRLFIEAFRIAGRLGFLVGRGRIAPGPRERLPADRAAP
jgi:glycosyltransferase involved in cell wall biosynthesis